MTITTTETRIAYAGNGSSTSFAVPFPFYGPDELRVYSSTDAGVQTLLVRGTSYTVSGGNGGSGTVTAVAAPAAGITWTIVRSTTPTQQVGFANAGPLPGPTVERTLDRLTAGWQETIANQARSLRVPDGEAALPSTLPSVADRKNKFLAFDANGNATASIAATGAVPISAAMDDIVGMATLAGARAALGVLRRVDAVVDHGADNSGTADATAAIQAAINSLTAGTVYLAPGNYKLMSDLTMKPNVVIEGDDPLQCTLTAGANGLKLLKYTAAALTNAFVVRKVGLSSGGFTGVYGIHLDGTDSSKRLALINIEDVYIATCARGVNLRFLANTRLEQVRCNTCDIGIYIDQCTDLQIDGGWCQNGSAEGILITGGPGAFDEGINITGWSTNGQYKGITVVGQDWGQITGCSITTCPGGVLLFQSSTAWQVANNQLAVAGGAPANPAVYCDVNCNGLQFSNNIVGLSTFGFSLLGARHVVNGNYLTGQSNADINIQATNCVVTGNVCHSTGIGFSITEQAGSDYNVISGNVCNGTVSVAGANTKVNGDNVVY
jgi:hypothetical protein